MLDLSAAFNTVHTPRGETHSIFGSSLTLVSGVAGASVATPPLSPLLADTPPRSLECWPWGHRKPSPFLLSAHRPPSVFLEKSLGSHLQPRALLSTPTSLGSSSSTSDALSRTKWRGVETGTEISEKEGSPQSLPLRSSPSLYFPKCLVSAAHVTAYLLLAAPANILVMTVLIKHSTSNRSCHGMMVTQSILLRLD